MNKTERTGTSGGSRKYTFSELFSSTQRASIRKSGKNTISNRTILPPLEDTNPEPAANPAEVPPSENSEGQPLPEDEVAPEIIDKLQTTRFPNISTYEGAGFAFTTEKEPPSDPLPMGPYNTPPQSILPKVQIPFITPPGTAPRAIEVERLKRAYQDMDINSLLSERGVDYPAEIEFIPINAEFPPIFKLWDFDDDNFDPRTVEEWLGLGRDENGNMAGVLTFFFILAIIVTVSIHFSSIIEKIPIIWSNTLYQVIIAGCVEVFTFIFALIFGCKSVRTKYYNEVTDQKTGKFWIYWKEHSTDIEYIKWSKKYQTRLEKI